MTTFKQFLAEFDALVGELSTHATNATRGGGVHVGNLVGTSTKFEKLNANLKESVDATNFAADATAVDRTAERQNVADAKRADFDRQGAADEQKSDAADAKAAAAAKK